MTLSTEELVAKAKDQLRRERYEEAKISAQRATHLEAHNPDAWWTLGRCYFALEDWPSGVRAMEKLTELAPDFPDGWAMYGYALKQAGRETEALEPLQMGLNLGTENIRALYALAAICESKKDAAGEYEALKRLDELNNVDSCVLLIRLGNAHFRADRHHDALKCYRRSARQREEASSLYNMGLVYNDPEISQDVDAIDAWRLATLRYPGETQDAEKKIASVLPRLLELRKEVTAQGDTVLEAEDWFSIYLNPFELLQVSEETSLDSLDAKAQQKLKKQLLSEIDLEDGKISWLADHVVDRSRALAACEELNDEAKRLAHWMVFHERSLLNFLSRGAHEFFTAHPHDSPIELLETMDSEDDTLLPWLSPIFARQYNKVLGKAMETRNLPLLESLFDGRRWVLPEHEDQCFESARRQVEQLLTPFKAAAQAAPKTKPTLAKVEELTQLPAVAILNLLPYPFRDLQNAAVKSLRDMSLAAHNEHGDSDLATSILELTRRFQFKSTALNHQLNEDYKTLQDILREQKKYEAHLTQGKTDWRITKDFVQLGERKVPVTGIQSVRWGIYFGDGSAQFTISFMDLTANELSFTWTAVKDLEANQKHFKTLLDATLTYVVPHVLERIQERLQANQPIYIGRCKLTKAGIEFEKQGFFTTKQIQVPWDRVVAKIEQGDAVVQDRTSPRNTLKLDIRTVQNAVMFPLLSDVDTTPPPVAKKPTSSSAGTTSGASRPAPQAAPPRPQPAPQQPYKPPQQPGSGSSSGKWWIGITAVIGVLWLIGQSNKNTPSPASAYSSPAQTAVPSYSPPPAQPQVPSRPAESKPPVGQDLVFSREQIAYCVAEDIRMEGAKSAVDNYSDSDVDRFNAMVADYNSRCSNFRYRRGALEGVRSSIEPYRSQLYSEGQQRLSRYRPQGSSSTPKAAPVYASNSRPSAPPPTYASTQQESTPSSLQLTNPEAESLEAACSTDKYVNGAAAYRACVEKQKSALAAGVRRPNLSALSYAERESIEAACSTDKYVNGPAAYNRCLSRQLAAMSGNRSNRPDLSRLSYSEKKSIEAACSTDKYVNGPAAYNRCLSNQLAALDRQGSRPDLSGLSMADRSSIEAACSTEKYVSGPAEYNRCLSQQLARLR